MHMNKNLLSRLTWALLAAAVLLAGIQAYLLLRPSPAAAQAGVQAEAQPSDASSAPLSSPAALAAPSALTASTVAGGREPEAAAAAIPAAPANGRAGGIAPLAANANTAVQSQSGKPAPEACQSAGAASSSAARTREVSSHKARSSAAPLAMREQTDNRDAKTRRRDSARAGSHGASLLMRLSDLCRPEAGAEAPAPLAPANLSAAPAALSAEDAVAYDTPKSSNSFAPAALTAEGLKSADEIPACSEEQHEDSSALPSALDTARNSGSDAERSDVSELEDAEAPGDLGNPDAADTRTVEPRNARKALATRDASEARDTSEARGAGHASGSRRASNGLQALDARSARNALNSPDAPEAASCAPAAGAPESSLRNASTEQNHASPAPVGLLQSSDGALSLAADFARYREALEGIDDRLPARRGTERVLFTLPGGEGAQVALRWQADRGRISSLSADLRTAQETRDLRLVVHLLRQSCAGGAEVLDLGLYLIRLPEPGQSEGFVHRAAFLRLSADGRAERFGD